MDKEITYIVEKNKAGEIRALYRFWDDDFSHEESLINGEWIQNNSLVSVLFNLHNPAYQEISATEAEKVACLFSLKVESNYLPSNDIIREYELE